MKKINVSIILLLVVILLAACSENPATTELKENDTNKAAAKVDASPAASGSTVGPAASAESATPSSEPSTSADKEKDIWTYYNDAKWSDDFKGLKTEIQKVVVTDKAPTMKEQDKFDHSAVGVKFRIENTTQELFTTYPDQAVLVTSTGEQIENPDMWTSDHIGGEIEEGVIKEGNVIWFLERGHAEDIKWVKLKWRAYKGDGFSDENKEYSVKIELKK